MKSKVLCIYLPQFHTIPENDAWWGEGFTEWTNVKRGKPFYPGHYQPREPLNDNYYNLADLKVLEQHTRLAKKAGIEGFCFYHYYFKGKKLLEKPIEMYRDKSKEEFPYCLIWANQSWSRTWYRGKAGNSVLMQQSYGDEEDWKQHFNYLLQYFKDKRYIKIDNKPVFIIYIPQDIKCRKKMFELWENMARENGFKGIYLVAMNTTYGIDKNEKLYSAYLNFEPLASLANDCSYRRIILRWKENHVEKLDIERKSIKNRIYTKNAYSYSYLCKMIERKNRRKGKKTFVGVFPGWDNTPRKDEAGIIVTGSSPRKFEKNVKHMLELSEKQGNEYIFVNAWNEWSEGAYLEADKRYRYSYLRALQRAVYDYQKQ